MDPIRLPPIYCPFPSNINPWVQEAHAHTLDWAQQYRLVRKEAALHRFAASRFTWLAARAYPTAAQAELEVVNDWLTWLFMFDDQFDEGLIGGRPERLVALLESYAALFTAAEPGPGQSPAAAALVDLCRRTRSQMPGTWWARFASHFSQYLSTYPWSVGNTARGVVPALVEYLERRRHSGGMYPAIDLIEFVLHRELPQELLGGSHFPLLSRLTNDVVCWSNDIFSLEKELARGDVNNLILVVERAQRIPLQEAVDQVGAMISSSVELFEQVERALPTFPADLEDAVQHYLSMLRAWMRGNLDWSIETGRYSQVERTAPGGVASYIEPIAAAATSLASE
jgi:Terpene synthase family 2, C-terminal metal binding